MAKPSKEIQARFDRLVEKLEGPVPVGVLANFLFGPIDPATGMPAKSETAGTFFYTDRERARILHIAEDNLKRLKNLPPTEHSELIACGGGPGSGKSTTLFRMLAQEHNISGLTDKDWAEPSLSTAMEALFLSKTGVPAALSAPDRKGLLQLALHDHAEPRTDEAFYIHNRAASNFLSLFEMNAAFTHKTNLVWDTTLGSVGAVANLKYAKDRGYKITAVLQGAPLDTRDDAVNDRAANGFYQCLPINITAQEEGFKNVFQQVVALADSVKLGWRDEAKQATSIVAEINPAQKQIVFLNEIGFDKLRALYPQIDALGFERVAARPGGIQGAAANTKDLT